MLYRARSPIDAKQATLLTNTSLCGCSSSPRAMQLEQLLSSTTPESIAESLHTVMIGVEENTGAVATDGGAPGSAERDGRAENSGAKVRQGRR